MKRILLLLICWAVADSCIERIDIEIPDSYANDLVVDGLITNEPGPYVVNLSRVIKVDDTKPLGVPVDAKSVTIYDDLGNSEELTHVRAGMYQTDPNGIRGEVGRTYHVRIVTFDGSVFESIPDTMDPVGAVDSIYYDLVPYQSTSGPTTYSYKVYIDAPQGGKRK